VLFKLGVIASLSESHLRYDADALFAARQIACIAAPSHRWNSSPIPRSWWQDVVTEGPGKTRWDGVFTGAPWPYLLFLNNVIPEDQVLDKESLPKVTMPIGCEFGKLHEFRLNAPSLKGYPY